MTITSSGAMCDVCDNYILPIMGDEIVHPFKLTNIEQETHACDTCIKIVKSIDKSSGGDGDWRKLPDGALRRAFEEAEGVTP